MEGNLVKQAWFQTYSELPSNDRTYIVQSWDIALTDTKNADYSVCTTWLIDGNRFYLVDVWRGQLEYPFLKKKVIALQKSYQARKLLIESAGLGLSLCQDLGQDMLTSVPNPIRIKPEGDKITRLQAVSAKIEAGQVYLPDEAEWLATFMHEMLGFPNTKHDDQVDSVSQFLAHARRHGNDTVLGIAGGKQENWAKPF